MGAIMFCIAVIVFLVCGAGFIGGIILVLREIAKFWYELTDNDDDKSYKG